MPTAESNNAYGVISDAMVDAGWLQEGERPNSEQLATNMRRLSDIINLWQIQGLMLFLQQEITLPMVVGKSKYIIGPIGPDLVMPRPARILSGYIQDVNEIRRPLTIISREEWDLLPEITGNNGEVNSFFVDKQASTLNLHLWMPPNSTEVLNTATFLAQVKATNPINLTDLTSFPQNWRIALRWGLADDICTGQPETIMARCQNKAMIYRQALSDWDVEDAPTYFSVNSRFYMNQGRFK